MEENNNFRIIYGVAVNNVDYVVQEFKNHVDAQGKRTRKLEWICPYQSTWKSMLTRCYCKKYNKARIAYEGCTVVDEWLTFSKFKAWMETQDWEGKQLDKDILVDGNMIYSPETCVFVSQKVNTFILGSKDKSNGLPKGVSRHSQNPNRYNINIAFNGKKILAPSFLCPYQAHLWYAKKKLELCSILIDIEKPDSRVGEKLLYRCKEQVTEAEKLLNQNS